MLAKWRLCPRLPYTVYQLWCWRIFRECSVPFDGDHYNSHFSEVMDSASSYYMRSVGSIVRHSEGPPFRKVRLSESRHSWSLHGIVLDIAVTRRLSLTLTVSLRPWLHVK